MSEIKKIIGDSYCDSNGNIREDLLLDGAKRIAKLLERESSSQIRQFFNEVKSLKFRIEDNKENFEKIYPNILILKSKAAYKYRNGNNKINKIKKEFNEFINVNVDIIKNNKNYETFEQFVTFFEVVAGYYYGLGNKNN